MADFNPPSAGEIAFGESYSNRLKIETLEKRIQALEHQVKEIRLDLGLDLTIKKERS